MYISVFVNQAHGGVRFIWDKLSFEEGEAVRVVWMTCGLYDSGANVVAGNLRPTYTQCRRTQAMCSD